METQNRDCKFTLSIGNQKIVFRRRRKISPRVHVYCIHIHISTWVPIYEFRSISMPATILSQSAPLLRTLGRQKKPKYEEKKERHRRKNTLLCAEGEMAKTTHEIHIFSMLLQLREKARARERARERGRKSREPRDAIRRLDSGDLCKMVYIFLAEKFLPICKRAIVIRHDRAPIFNALFIKQTKITI